MRIAALNLITVILLAGCSRGRGGEGAREHPVFALARGSVFAVGGAEAGIGGSGFLLRAGSARYLVTSFHVVAKLERIWAQAEDGARFEGLEVLAVDRPHDVAVLSAESFPAKRRALEAETHFGTSQPVVLMGYPAMSWRDAHLNFATGWISDARYRAPAFLDQGEQDYIQVTTPINLGHSGSPLLDAAGRVLGVVAWRFEPQDAIQGGNYAVPIRWALAAIGRLRPPASPLRPPEAPGAACRYDRECAGLAFCVESRCDRPRRVGEGCEADEDCWLPSICEGFACTRPREAGGTCSDDALCRPPLVCVLGRCGALAELGGGCALDEDCAPPLVCRSGICRKGTRVAPARCAP